MEAIRRERRLRAAMWATGLAFALGLGARAEAGLYSELYVFGDSLSDSGNTFAAAGIPGAPYVDGRFSNGPNWIDRLAARLGAPAPTPSVLGGTNFAWGYARSGGDFSYPMGPDGPGVPNLLTQLGMFQLGGGELTRDDLVSIWVGANDFLNGETDHVHVVDNIIASIQILAAQGGMNFVVGNMPPLAALPATLGLPAAARTVLSVVTNSFNATLAYRLELLREELPDVNIFLNDVHSEFGAILANPSAYGLTNVTDPAMGPSAFSPGPVDAEGYLFWDGLHPTAAVHELIADRAFAAVGGTAAVPEPSSLALSALAGAALLAAARARRAA